MGTIVTARRVGQPDQPVGIIAKLQSIQIGGSPRNQIRRKDLVLVLRNLSTLVENGVSLAQALSTVAADDSLKKHRVILNSLAESVRTGKSLSAAMCQFPTTFNGLFINQVRVGERSGTLNETLGRVTDQLEQGASLKSFIIKKLTYPAILVTAGVGSVTFMLLCVIPTFQKMYSESGATLPMVTQLLIDAGEVATHHGGKILIGVGLAIAAVITLFRNTTSRLWIDRHLIRLPLLGKWFRNLAILQFADVLNNLLESGFTVAEALPPSAEAINNRYIRNKIRGLHSAIRRGERFSKALEIEGDLFPPVVKQLVVVGERTGRLAAVSRQIRIHLRRDVDSYTNAMVGAIEPVLTASLALVVGGILLAVYLPMFDMIGQVNK
ncbi:MAG: type II secretion system F family protein [Pirellulaceae bacterium]